MKFLCFIIWIILLCSCNEQNVITKLDANNGILNVSFNPSPSFGSVLPGTFHEKTITLNNLGGFPLTSLIISGIAGSLAYQGGTYPGTNGTCGSSLLPGQSCNITIALYSEEQQILSTNLVINYNDGITDKTQSFSINADISNPGSLIIAQGYFGTLPEAVSNNTNSIRFPRLALGNVQEEIITMANNGGRTITLLDIPVLPGDLAYSGGLFPGDTGDCGLTLAPSALCVFVVSQHTSVEGQSNLEIPFPFYNGSETATRQLQFTLDVVDERADLILLGPGTINLGNIPQNYNIIKTVDIINNSVVASINTIMSLTNISGGLTFTGTAGYPGLGGNCDDSLDPGDFCSIEFSFVSSDLGIHNEILSIDYNDNHISSPLAVTATSLITANVVPPALITINATYSVPNTTPNIFGTKPVGNVETRVLSLENSGGYKAKSIAVELINNPSGVFALQAGGNCGVTVTSLNPTGRCTVKIKVQSDLIGNFNADLKISYDDGLGDGIANTSSIFPLSVSYVDVSNLRFLPSSNIDFGEVLFGLPSTNVTVTLNNQSAGTATDISLDMTNLITSDFDFISTTCTATLSGNSSCEYIFQITPTVLGIRFTGLTLNYNDLLGSSIRNLTLRATSRNPSDLFITDLGNNNLNSIDFQDTPVGKTYTLPIRITNPSSNITARNVIPTISNPHFSVIDFDPDSCSSFSNFDVYQADICDIEIAFTPSAPGNYSATLSLTYNNGLGIVVEDYPVLGEGVNSGLLEISGITRFGIHNFGNGVTNNTTSFYLTLENTGTATVSAYSATGLGGRFTWGASDCVGVDIPPGGTCQQEIFFNPVATGDHRSWYGYDYFTSLSTKQFSFEIVAYGISPADIFVNFATGPNSYNFGDVPFLLTRVLSITLSNVGAASANNFSVALNQGALTSYNYFTNCIQGGSLASGNFCQINVTYSPEDQTTHSASVSINYNGYGNETLPIIINISGRGVDPIANFAGWYEIFSVTDDSTGTIRLKWDAMIPASAGVVVDGYKVYQRIGSPLPTTLASMAPYEVASINGIQFSDRIYTVNNVPPDTSYHFAIRPTYLGRIIDSTDKAANLNIITPPLHMALVHPYAVNKNVCQLMGLATDANHQLGCAYTGRGSTDGYYIFDRLLYVDRYELSLNAFGEPQNLPGQTPTEYMYQFMANDDCNNVVLSFDGNFLTKRLLRRSEFAAAAAWPANLITADIEARETGNATNYCKVAQDNPSSTGTSTDCVSRYGIYDMVGNLWEWNTDQINGTIGWTTPLDPSNDEIYGIILGTSGMFPNYVVNLPCYSVAMGFVISYGSGSVCTDGLKASDYPNLFSNDYFWTPISAELKGVRSGGGVGTNGNFYARKAGRWIADFSTSLTTSVSKTGARCSFSLPFEE